VVNPKLFGELGSFEGPVRASTVGNSPNNDFVSAPEQMVWKGASPCWTSEQERLVERSVMAKKVAGNSVGGWAMLIPRGVAGDCAEKGGAAPKVKGGLVYGAGNGFSTGSP